jgi:energy-converting hydrogenase Eha subunit B
MMNGEMGGGGYLMMLVWAVIVVVPFWRICQKAGYPGALGLLIVVPLVNLVFLYYLAFATWPAHKAAAPTGGPG